MQTETYWLGLIVLMTALLWIPYGLNLFVMNGPVNALRYYGPQSTQLSEWARRAKSAHGNAIENLAVLAPAALLYIYLHPTLNDTQGILIYLQIYFFARLAHYVIYALGWPYLRTVMFLAGWVCTICILVKVLQVG